MKIIDLRRYKSVLLRTLVKPIKLHPLEIKLHHKDNDENEEAEDDDVDIDHIDEKHKNNRMKKRTKEAMEMIAIKMMRNITIKKQKKIIKKNLLEMLSG
jgi:hypothetical protein